MESSRDSSVWRSLAVTFGGGLALGAVGMKLTQTALRPMEAPPRPEPETGEFAGRLSTMERRLERMEQSPAPAHPVPAPSQPAPATIDQKVLEAVIAAVEARLHEHSGQMDRRLADIEARLAVSQSGQQQDRRVSQQLREETAALRTVVESDMRQVRESVARALAGQSAANEERFASVRQEIEQSAEARAVTAAVEHVESDMSQVRESVARALAGQSAANEERFASVRQEIEQSVEARAVTAAAEHVESDMRQVRESVARALAGQSAANEERFASVRQEIEQSVEARAVTAAAAMAEQMDRQLAPLGAEIERVSQTISGQAAANEQRFASVREEIEQSVEARVVTAAAAAVAEQMDRQLAPLRAEVEQKEKELAELRVRLADSERSVLDVVLAIGDVCRQAADRIGGPREQRPTPPAPIAPISPVAPVAELRPRLEAIAPASAPCLAEPVAIAPPAPPAHAENLPVPLAGGQPALAPALPGFLQEGNHHANWRIPLVSSFLVCTGYLFLMHYLALPLQ